MWQVLELIGHLERCAVVARRTRWGSVVRAWCWHLGCDSSEARRARWVASGSGLRLRLVLGDLDGWDGVLQDDSDDASRLGRRAVLGLRSAIRWARLAAAMATSVSSTVRTASILALFTQQDLTDLIQQLRINRQAFLCVASDCFLLVATARSCWSSTERRSASGRPTARRWSVIVVASRSLTVCHCGQGEDRELIQNENEC